MAPSSVYRAALIVDESDAEGRKGALPEDAGMAERVAAWLRVDAETVWALTDRNAREEMTVGRIERVDLAVVASRQPQHLVVCRHAAHVGTASARNLPLRRDLARSHVDNRDRSFAAVRDIEALRVAAEVQAVRPLARRDEPDVLHGLSVDEKHAVAHHVGDKVDAAVRCDPRVLRHRRVLRLSLQLEAAHDLSRGDVHLD